MIAAARLHRAPVDPDTDIEALLDLSNAAAIAEYGVPDVDERLLRGAYRLPAFVAERDCLLVLDPMGARRHGRVLRQRGQHMAPYFFVRVRPEDGLAGDRTRCWPGAPSALRSTCPLRARARAWRCTSTVAAVNSR